MKALHYLLGAALLGCSITKAVAVILPPTDDTSGSLTYNKASPPVVTRRTLTTANGSSGSLPVSRSRTAFVRFAVEDTGLTAGNLGKAQLMLYFPTVIKAGDISLHVVTQDWDENFPLPEKSRVHPTFEAVPFLTIPAASVVRRQFVIVDVTEQMRATLASPGTRFGFAVSSPDGIANIAIGSKEGSGTGYPPLLEMEADGATSENLANTIVKRDGEGNFMVGTITGSLVGNASTAGTAMNFTGVLGGDVTGTQGATVVGAVGGAAASDVATGANLANDATSANSANAIVKRNAAGDFAAGTITGVLNGNATTATTANSATNFTGSLAGDVTGMQEATVVSSVGGVAAANVASGANIANAATAANTPNTLVKRDGNGVVTATAFVGDGSGLTAIPATAIVAPPPGMMLIPAGTFTIGDNLDNISNAVPVSTTVSAFYMDVNEVSLSQWQSVYFWATSNGYAFANTGAGKGANHPVQTVDWYDCVKWCNARSEQAGKTPVYYTDDAQTMIYKTGNINVTNAQVKWTANGYRLPTEAEWEKAARGGRIGLRFPWGDTITQNLANYNSDFPTYAYDLGLGGYNPIGSVGGIAPATSPVGSFAANGYGLNDMAGNIREWCWDWYGVTYAGGTDPHGPATGSLRINRGGSWSNNANFARCASRHTNSPSALGLFGFRSVMPAGQP